MPNWPVKSVTECLFLDSFAGGGRTAIPFFARSGLRQLFSPRWRVVGGSVGFADLAILVADWAVT